MVLVFVAMGGNIGDTVSLFGKVLKRIKREKGISKVKVSSFYQTSPVSPIPQKDYVNAVCSFHTRLPILDLFAKLEAIEQEFGKGTKGKNEPRIIDLDLLFYGKKRYSNGYLEVPHPLFRERLFVLEPLMELYEIHSR